MHDTGDRYAKDVCDHERQSDISEQAVQFADRAFRLLSARLRKCRCSASLPFALVFVITTASGPLPSSP